ncbi:MAG: hypothetical protein QM496_07485 [Verrucomicrobiota bacterium]
MKKLITVLVLLMWVGCFFHCSVEQWGEVEHASLVQVVDGGLAGEKSGSDEENCELCDFARIGGALTITSLSLLPLADDFGKELADFFSLSLILPEAELAEISSCKKAEEQILPLLCEVLVRTGFPVRGPAIA